MDRYEISRERNSLKNRRKALISMNGNFWDEICKLNKALKTTTDKKERKEHTIKKDKLCRIEKYTREKVYEITNELNAEIHSELPLLLFVVNESKMTSNSYLPIWEYVYYYPDYDEIEKVVRDGTVSLNPKDINLTDLFHDFGMPDEILSNPIHYGKIDKEYDDVINNAVNTTKTIIDQIFEENEINSWSDVGTHLKKFVEKRKEEDKKNDKKHLKLI